MIVWYYAMMMMMMYIAMLFFWRVFAFCYTVGVSI